MNKKILFLMLLAVLLLPLSIFATTPTVITSIVDASVNTALYIASGIVVILWVVTGILFLTAQGAPEKLSAAKKALFAAVAGTILVIVAESALTLVGSAIGLSSSTTTSGF